MDADVDAAGYIEAEVSHRRGERERERVGVRGLEEGIKKGTMCEEVIVGFVKRLLCQRVSVT